MNHKVTQLYEESQNSVMSPEAGMKSGNFMKSRNLTTLEAERVMLERNRFVIIHSQ
jgi:hypothetical protein